MLFLYHDVKTNKNYLHPIARSLIRAQHPFSAAMPCYLFIAYPASFLIWSSIFPHRIFSRFRSS